MTFSELIIVLVALAAYANPVLLFVVWVKRLRTSEKKSWRPKLGLASLVLASLGFGVVVCFMTCGPEAATPAFDIWFRKCFWVSAGVCVVVLITGVVGTGKMQWVVLVSSVVSPLSILMGKVME
jgi:peptidoglycan biosynthesis protein MviN/MurJ (putative lipid II flippase)